MYRTVNADLSDLEDVFYDVIAFFSPADIKSLFDNFPDFEQNDTRIAGWGAQQTRPFWAKLNQQHSSTYTRFTVMTAAIEAYIKSL